VVFRENYQNMGVNDKEWKTWRIFNEPVIQKIRFEETQRNYIGEVKSNNPQQAVAAAASKKKLSQITESSEPDTMHGFGVFVFKKRRHRYEGEFIDDNFNDGGIRYEGNFVDGRFCGQGFGKYPNGDMFVGDWKDNAKHGEGMIYFEDGS
jgi:hypothetical protein